MYVYVVNEKKYGQNTGRFFIFGSSMKPSKSLISIRMSSNEYFDDFEILRNEHPIENQNIIQEMKNRIIISKHFNGQKHVGNKKIPLWFSSVPLNKLNKPYMGWVIEDLLTSEKIKLTHHKSSTPPTWNTMLSNRIPFDKKSVFVNSTRKYVIYPQKYPFKKNISLPNFKDVTSLFLLSANKNKTQLQTKEQTKEQTKAQLRKQAQTQTKKQNIQKLKDFFTKKTNSGVLMSVSDVYYNNKNLSVTKATISNYLKQMTCDGFLFKTTEKRNCETSLYSTTSPFKKGFQSKKNSKQEKKEDKNQTPTSEIVKPHIPNTLTLDEKTYNKLKSLSRDYKGDMGTMIKEILDGDRLIVNSFQEFINKRKWLLTRVTYLRSHMGYTEDVGELKLLAIEVLETIKEVEKCEK